MGGRSRLARPPRFLGRVSFPRNCLACLSPGPGRVLQRQEHRESLSVSDTRWRADDFYGAFGMASDEFGHAAKQETPDASLSVRTNDDQIGAPLGCRIDDPLSDVTYLDGSVHLESRAQQLLRNSPDQLTGRLFLLFQLGSITWRHLRGSWRNRLQHMQNPDLRMLSPKLRDNSPQHIPGDLRIVNSYQDFHDSSSSRSNRGIHRHDARSKPGGSFSSARDRTTCIEFKSKAHLDGSLVPCSQTESFYIRLAIFTPKVGQWVITDYNHAAPTFPVMQKKSRPDIGRLDFVRDFPS